MKSIYDGLCPNCDAAILDEELVKYGVCRSCLIGVEKGRVVEIKPGRYSEILQLHKKVSEFEEFFQRLIGSRPWSLQRTWIKRVLLGRSFSIVAPTGTGKTTFCLVTALHNALQNQKSYILVPTSLLVQHILDRAASYTQLLSPHKPRVVGYYSSMRKREMEEAIKKIQAGDFDIIVTTDRFLYSRFDLIKDKRFKFIFVDDVDSFLKSPRNIDKVLNLMGFSEAQIERLLAEEDNPRAEGPGTPQDPKTPAKPESVLIVAGATVRGRRTKRVKLFRKALNFEPGSKIDIVRNIANLYLRPSKDIESQVEELIRKHGGGCLVFVPQSGGLQLAKTLARHLNQSGIPSYAYERMNPKMLERFVRRDYEVLIGVASTRSPLARGIDLPERIRYVIFAGVPRRELLVSWNEYRPSALQSVIRYLMPILEEGYRSEVLAVSGMLFKCIPTRADVLEEVRKALESGKEPEGFAGYVYRAVKRARELLRSAIQEGEIRRIAEMHDLRLRVSDQGFSIILPDIDGYVQASGRASRLYAAGITRGVSIVLVDDEKAFRGLMRGLESLYEEEFREYSESIAAEEFRKCDEDRQRIRQIMEGRIPVGDVDLLRSALVIVESPTKARTLSYFFGSPSRREIDGLTVFESMGEGYVACFAASQGHVVDLSTESGFHGVLLEGVDYVPVYTTIRKCARCGAQLTSGDACPNCGSTNLYSKKGIIEALRSLALEFDEVLIATDPDSEGEKIGYDLYVSVNPFNRNIKRLELHEITRRALREALRSPRDISLPLVEAQVVRRIEDRWVGFELSRRLWEHFGRKTLSAGRVQTPVLGWIIQRMEEAKKRRIMALLRLEDGTELELVEPPRVQEMAALFKENALYIEVSVEGVSEEEVLPPPPYTTDSLLRDASIILKMGASETMRVAQTLFESGLITYHRTGSTYVSTTGISVARTYIEENHSGFFSPRHYGAPGAHECIRPTKPLNRRQLEFYIQSGMLRIPARLESEELGLYDLVFRRFIASQMTSARVQKSIYRIRVGGEVLRLERLTGIASPGFTLVYPSVRIEKQLPIGVQKVVDLSLRKVPAAPLFREGDLISLMKERSIGRPSTYAHIIGILYKRGYIFQNRGRLLATNLGKRVYDFLTSNYGHLVSEELTRRLEALMDEVESGRVSYLDVLRDLHREILPIATGAA